MDKSYKITTDFIDQNILYIELKGIFTYKDLELLIEELKEKTPIDTPIVTIIDIKDLRLATPKAIRDSVRKITIFNIIGRIYINVPKFLVNKTKNIREKQAIPILFADDFKEAFFMAKKIIKTYHLNENWRYQIGNFTFEAKLVSNKILYLKYIGPIIAEESFEFIEKLTFIFSIIKEKEIVVIHNFKEMGTNSIKSKKDFTDFFKNNSKIKGSIFFGVSDVYKLQIKVAVNTNFISYPIIIKETYKDSLEIANKILIDEYQEKNSYLDEINKSKIKQEYLNKIFIILNKRYIKDIKRYLFSIQRGKNNRVINNSIKNHPFKEILESFRTILEDIHDLSSNYEFKKKELLKAQKELVETNKKLEKKVNKRKDELTKVNLELKRKIKERKSSEQKVNISRKIAERENMTKNIFLKGVSGKLKISVDDILFTINNLKKNNSFEHAHIRRELQKIISSSDKLFENVQNLVTHSQLESGNIKYDINLNSFLKVINHSILNAQLFVKEKNITIITSNPDNLKEYFLFDNEKITQVVDNLLLNAIKYSNKNSQITITTSNYKDKLKFVISDSGIGIKTKSISVFDDFSTTISLMISKKIINHHGGRIWVKNNKDEGATFTFTLPINIK